MLAILLSYKGKNGKTITVREATISDAEEMLVAAPKALVDAPYMLSTVEGVKKVSLEDMRGMLGYYAQNSNYVKLIIEVDG